MSRSVSPKTQTIRPSSSRVLAPMSAASHAGSRADATIWLALLADGSEPCTSGAGQLGSRVATAAFLGDSSRESRCASPSEVQPAVSAIAAPRSSSHGRGRDTSTAWHSVPDQGPTRRP